jgi:hypothetical protein
VTGKIQDLETLHSDIDKWGGKVIFIWKIKNIFILFKRKKNTKDRISHKRANIVLS